MPTPNNTSIFEKLQNNRSDIAKASVTVSAAYSFIYSINCAQDFNSPFCTNSTAKKAFYSFLMYLQLAVFCHFLNRKVCITQYTSSNTDSEHQLSEANAPLIAGDIDPPQAETETEIEIKPETETETEEGKAPPPSSNNANLLSI